MSSDTSPVDNTEDATVGQIPTVDPEQAEDAATGPPDSEVEESSNAEAAKWRKKCRDIEGQRDELASKVAALQKAQAEQIITAANVKPQAVWATTDLDALLAEDGTVSPDLVAAAVQTARDQLGITQIGKGVYVPGIGGRPSGTPQPRDAFTEAFKPRSR